MRLDEVVTGRVQFKGVIDEIAAEAAKLIAVLRQHTGALVDLSRPAPIAYGLWSFGHLFLPSADCECGAAKACWP